MGKNMGESIHIGLSGNHFGPIRRPVVVPTILKEALGLLLTEHANWKPSKTVKQIDSDDDESPSPASTTSTTMVPNTTIPTTTTTTTGYLGKKLIPLPPRRSEEQLARESTLLGALDWKSNDLGRSVSVTICGVTRELKRFAAVISTRRYSLYTACEDFGLPSLHNLYHMDVAVFAHEHPGVLVSMTYLKDIVDTAEPLAQLCGRRVCVRSWLTACGKVKVVHCDTAGGDFRF